MLLLLDLLGVAVFAVSGGLLAVRRGLDIVGVAVLGVTTALAGGVIRDLLIGDVPPPGFADWRYLSTALVAGLVAFYFHPALERTVRMVNVFDAFGLGLFAVAGAVKASEAGLGPLPAALLGVVTGVGGGIVRDVLTARVPAILTASELYAIPAFAGSAVAVAGHHLGLPTATYAVPAAGLIIAVRLLAIWRGWTAPVARSRES